MSPMRDVWMNCPVNPTDPDIMRIDLMQDALMPLADLVRGIRLLISQLEASQYTFSHDISRILSAIATGHIPQTAPPTCLYNAREQLCIALCEMLDGWCAGRPPSEPGAGIDPDEFLPLAGAATPLRIWQVQRICDKLRAFTSPALHYVEIVESRSLYESRYPAHLQLRAETVRTLINDTVDGEPARVSLDSAIDHLEPSHWAFESNLRILLAAIGGDLDPLLPLAWNGRNRHLRPDRQALLTLAEALLTWSGFAPPSPAQDALPPHYAEAIASLGQPDAAKLWLTASLAKTIALQLA